jgi:hypothetical protein
LLLLFQINNTRSIDNRTDTSVSFDITTPVPFQSSTPNESQSILTEQENVSSNSNVQQTPKHANESAISQPSSAPILSSSVSEVKLKEVFVDELQKPCILALLLTLQSSFFHVLQRGHDTFFLIMPLDLLNHVPCLFEWETCISCVV